MTAPVSQHPWLEDEEDRDPEFPDVDENGDERRTEDEHGKPL